MARATGGILSSRQWTTWGGTGRATWGIDFPVSGKGARPPSGGTGEVPLGLEASVELEAKRRRLSPDDIGLLPATADLTRQGGCGDASRTGDITERRVDSEEI